MQPQDNPFTILTAIVAPAVLTNACSVLCLATGNRIARVVDRTRAVTAELSALEPDSPEYSVRARQIERLRIRNNLLYKALRLQYTALGSFAASAIISVIGAALVYFGNALAFHAIAAVALAIGMFSIAALIAGCAYMVGETRLAVRNLAEDAELALARHERGEQPARYLG
ncbi:MAG: DUF2721 domain-containing protein [Candidatus Korobacteraceae bacterium]|jgi:hypothetical protein